jgi:hypothetical protein
VYREARVNGILRHVRKLQLVVMVLTGLLVASPAVSRDAGVADAPLVNPMSVVMATPGIGLPVFSHSQRVRGTRPWEESFRLPVARSTCYEILGYAMGALPVFAQVMVNGAHLGDSLPLANSASRVARQRFCVTQPSELYSLTLRAEGEAWMYVAIVSAGAVDANALSRPVVTATPVRVEASRPEVFPLGGDDDFVGRQIQAFARQRPGMTGLTRAVRQTLPTNGVFEAMVTLPSGRCVDVVAAGVPSVADLVVELEDPSGRRVALDATRRNVESVRHCAAYAGAFRMRVRVFSGHGLVGVQALLEP